jgi:hypothetical protein
MDLFFCIFVSYLFINIKFIYYGLDLINTYTIKNSVFNGLDFVSIIWWYQLVKSTE